MERISNSYPGLIEQVRIELETFELNHDEYLLVSYLEFPALGGGQFNVAAIGSARSTDIRLERKSWDSEYDLQRFSTGVYNLDRLCIKEKKFVLTENQQRELRSTLDSIDYLPETLEEQGYIILDGIEYKLFLNTENAKANYEWRMPSHEVKRFELLINLLLAYTTGQ